MTYQFQTTFSDATVTKDLDLSEEEMIQMSAALVRCGRRAWGADFRSLTVRNLASGAVVFSDPPAALRTIPPVSPAQS